MRLGEIHAQCPALRGLHGGSSKAFEIFIYRSAHPNHQNQRSRRAGVGSGCYIDYSLHKLRAAAVQLLVGGVLPNAVIAPRALMTAEWDDGFVCVELANGDAFLNVRVPTDLWAELNPCAPESVEGATE
jgi:hypothetical protein